MTNSSTRNMIRIRFTIMAFSILGLVLASLKSAITRFAIALQDRARLSITEPNKPILAHSFQQLMERILGDLLIAALASALSVRLVLLVYSRLLRDNSNSDSDAPSHSASIKVKLALDWSITGPEFDYLKTIKEISRNEEITAFVEKAHSSLEYRGSFMQLDPYERSLLHYAAMGNCTSLLLFPLQSSPNIDSRDHWGRTPLSWAAEYGSLTVTKVLLSRGADINAVDYEGIAPLNWLVEAGDPKIETLPAMTSRLARWCFPSTAAGSCPGLGTRRSRSGMRTPRPACKP
jgi:hypothetical protein